ncbi:O-antigen ligase family protein [Halorarum halophilum]|uniref:O-antigen ligase family protein n=1 Tax=Halorarum halophilum TaxID=2743090 RepID=A0A7D5GD77_9EURY|nr:O-antigen ligase family protein [Halobaculum halophilum]QLG28685.1 O-antigen ligase family protein [Halobaculum halophilum]
MVVDTHQRDRFKMPPQIHTAQEKLASAALFAVLAILLVALHRAHISVVFAITLLSLLISFYRPVALIYFLAALTLFAPELPVGPGVSLNVFLLSGLCLAIIGRMALSGTWTLPDPKYITVVILFSIAGILSLLKALLYFDVPTVVMGALYLAQWSLYLTFPALMTVYLRKNTKQQINVMSFLLVVSAVMALYLFALFLLDIRPTETTIRIAGHRPLVAFWQQSQLAVGMFTSLTSIVSFSIAIKHPRERVTGSLFTLSALCGFLTLATLARSAILGLVIGIFIVVLLEYRWKTLFVVAITVPVGIIIAPEWLLIRFTRSTFFWREVPALGIKIPIGTLWKRVNGWVKLSTVFVHNPLFGIGFSLSQERMAQLFSNHISPDNQYVALLVETGIVGFMIFCMWVRLVYWRLFEAYRESTFEMSGLALGMIGAFTAFLVWGFFQEFYARWRVLGPLFTYFGLIYAAHDRSTGEG